MVGGPYHASAALQPGKNCGIVQLKCDGTRWRREGKWRGNWRMEWVTSTIHTTSEHGVSSITTADRHTSAASSRLNWRPCQFKWTRPYRRKKKSRFCACAITFQTQSIPLIGGWVDSIARLEVLQKSKISYPCQGTNFSSSFFRPGYLVFGICALLVRCIIFKVKPDF